MQFILPLKLIHLIMVVQLAKLFAEMKLRHVLNLVIAGLVHSSIVFANTSPDFQLSHIIQTDPVFSKHILIIEKSQHLIHLYSTENNQVKKIKSYPIASGKIPGDKKAQGDEKTPEGIYFLGGFYNSSQLIKMYGDYGKIYGIGAFTSDYPNPVDKLNGKTGDGIWLHSTNDASRIEKQLDSRGCVVVDDKNLRELSQYIDINKGTPYIVTQELNFWDNDTFNNNKEDINRFVSDWINAWKTQNLESYLSHYDTKQFKTKKGIKFQAYKNSKRNVFNNTKFAKINMDNISILKFKDYAVLRMKQTYESNLMSDTGFKTIYLKKNDLYEWKIVWEQWNKLPEQKELAFSKNNKGYFEQ